MPFRKCTTRLVGVAIAACAAAGCVTTKRAYVLPPPPDHDFQFRVSEGHMPRLGECRIWYPNVPPDKQSPPGRCIDLERNVPPGAILVRGYVSAHREQRHSG